MYVKNLQIGAYFVDSTNINSLNALSTGIYSINNFDGNILDCPFGGVGMCICAKESDNYAFQIAMEYNNGIYYRHNDNSTWKSWKQII